MKKLFNILETIILAILFFGIWLGIPIFFYDPEDEGLLNILCCYWILAPAGYVVLWHLIKESKKEKKKIDQEEFEEKYINKKD